MRGSRGIPYVNVMSHLYVETAREEHDCRLFHSISIHRTKCLLHFCRCWCCCCGHSVVRTICDRYVNCLLCSSGLLLFRLAEWESFVNAN